jgi:hypothetical protein
MIINRWAHRNQAGLLADLVRKWSGGTASGAEGSLYVSHLLFKKKGGNRWQ